MKVLHVLHDSLPILSGYAIRSANIVRFQAAEGLSPVVLTSPQHTSSGGQETEVINGIRYYRTSAGRSTRIAFLREMFNIRTMEKRISEIVKVERADVLHAHSPCLWGRAAGQVARKHSLPFVYEIRGLWEDAAVDIGKTTPHSLRYRLTRGLETHVARTADAVVTIAEHLKADLVDRGVARERISLVPNGVDTDRFVPTKRDQQLLDQLGINGSTCIGYLGTLHPWEGVEDLVRAACEIVVALPNAKVLIAGAGSEANRIRQLIDSLNLRQHVIFLGKVPHDQVQRYYSVMDILVYPRRSTRNTECVTPLKPLEAMAMEKPIVGSDVGGIRELLTESIGVTFKAGNVANLAQKCIALAGDARTRGALGRRARAYVIQNRNWKTLVIRYLDIYARILPGNA